MDLDLEKLMDEVRRAVVDVIYFGSGGSEADAAFVLEKRMDVYRRVVLAFLRLCPQAATAAELRRAMDAYTGLGDYLGGGKPCPSPPDEEAGHG